MAKKNAPDPAKIISSGLLSTTILVLGLLVRAGSSETPRRGPSLDFAHGDLRVSPKKSSRLLASLAEGMTGFWSWMTLGGDTPSPEKSKSERVSRFPGGFDVLGFK